MELKIATYNINGLRSAINAGFNDWLAEQNYDIICFQEIKSTPEQIDTSIIETMGYHHYWHPAEKKGYSGVSTFTKLKPKQVILGMGNTKYDYEGRILRTDFEKFTLLNCYFPSGSSSEERHDFKMQFLMDFQPYIKELKKEQPNLIILGDYNIVHTRLDIHNPDRKDNPSGYRPEERSWLSQWFDELSIKDAFRSLHPDQREYSWWSFRAGSKKKNLGWRIDYISLTESMLLNLKSAAHRSDILFSDHCPVDIVIDI